MTATHADFSKLIRISILVVIAFVLHTIFLCYYLFYMTTKTGPIDPDASVLGLGIHYGFFYPFMSGAVLIGCLFALQTRKMKVLYRAALLPLIVTMEPLFLSDMPNKLFFLSFLFAGHMFLFLAGYQVYQMIQDDEGEQEQGQ